MSITDLETRKAGMTRLHEIAIEIRKLLDECDNLDVGDLDAAETVMELVNE